MDGCRDEWLSRVVLYLIEYFMIRWYQVSSINRTILVSRTESISSSLIDHPDNTHLTLMLLVANLVNMKWWQKAEKWLKPWQMGTHLRVLSETIPMNTSMTGLRCFHNFLPFCAFDEINHSRKGLTNLCLKVTLEIVVWNFATFDNNLLIKNYFTKYLKKSCW